MALNVFTTKCQQLQVWFFFKGQIKSQGTYEQLVDQGINFSGMSNGPLEDVSESEHESETENEPLDCKVWCFT